MEKLAFYCVCDRAHFIGLVALVNSLRVLGHDERVYVLDCGLEPWQRAVLAQDREVAVINAENSRHPMLLKVVLPLACPAQIMIVVDVDVIFTGRVDTLVDTAAAAGKPIFFPDCWADRFQPAWERLGFGRPIPHPYVASGQLVVPAECSQDFLTLWALGLERLATDPTLGGSSLPMEENPFFFPDMDVLNALIGPAIPIDSFVLADTASAAYPPFDGVRVLDSERLLVESADGSRPILLHHFMHKPWNHLIAPNPYTRLMTRLLGGDDIALRTAPGRIPHSLRLGIRGAVARRYVVSRLWVRTMRADLDIRARLAHVHMIGRRSSAQRA